jgi:hypothetical protein
MPQIKVSGGREVDVSSTFFTFFEKFSCFCEIQFYFLKFISIFAVQNWKINRDGYTHRMVEKSPAYLSEQAFFSFGLSRMRFSTKHYCPFGGRPGKKHSVISGHYSHPFVFHFHGFTYQIRLQARRIYNQKPVYFKYLDYYHFLSIQSIYT